MTATAQRWTTDALVLLAACGVSGALGGIIGALVDRRQRCCVCSAT